DGEGGLVEGDHGRFGDRGDGERNVARRRGGAFKPQGGGGDVQRRRAGEILAGMEREIGDRRGRDLPDAGVDGDAGGGRGRAQRCIARHAGDGDVVDGVVAVGVGDVDAEQGRAGGLVDGEGGLVEGDHGRFGDRGDGERNVA